MLMASVAKKQYFDICKKDANLPNCWWSANILGSFRDNGCCWQSITIECSSSPSLQSSHHSPTFQSPFSSGGAQSVTDSQRQKTEFQTNFTVSPKAAKSLKARFSEPLFLPAHILSIADFKHWQLFWGNAMQEYNNRERNCSLTVWPKRLIQLSFCQV